MDEICIRVLLDLKKELGKLHPNLDEVYKRWSGKNFDDFAAAIVKLERNGYINIPKKHIVWGGDGNIPVDIIVDDIVLTDKGEAFLNNLELK